MAASAVARVLIAASRKHFVRSNSTALPSARPGESQTSSSSRIAQPGPFFATANPGPISNFQLGGEYNVWNATAAAALAANYGLPKDAIAEALATFRSVKRRLEVKAEVNGITIIDDFAHHPTAIEQTIRALRARYAQRRLWVVLEPRSNTMRRNVLQDALARSLAQADEVVVAAIFKSEAIPEAERLDLNQVVSANPSSAASQPAFCPTPMRSSAPSLPNCAPAMWLPSFPMADSAAFMRSYRNACAL